MTKDPYKIIKKLPSAQGDLNYWSLKELQKQGHNINKKIH